MRLIDTNHRKVVLAALYRRDVKQRQSAVAWDNIVAGDNSRACFASAVLAARHRSQIRAAEAFSIAIILQHAGDYRGALRAAERVLACGDSRGAWLIAVVMDRWSMVTTGKQLYGTQYEARDTAAWTPKPMHDADVRRRADILKAVAST